MRISVPLCLCGAFLFAAIASAGEVEKLFFKSHCVSCHDADTKEGGLDLTTFKQDLANAENFARWIKIHDRIESGEMPPKNQPRPKPDEINAVTKSLRDELVTAETKRLSTNRTGIRRLTRAEYENTIRDLFDMPGIALYGSLPADGSAHGFDKNSDALDISHVNMAKYVEAADHILDLAIATQPQPPVKQLQRISLARHVGHILGNGDAVLLKNKQPDPEYPPAGEQGHIDQGAHERIGSFERNSSTGVFRHEDESFNPYFLDFAVLYPGRYRLKASFFSFGWDKGTVTPARGTEAARLSAVQLSQDGRHGGHPSYVLGYFAAPSLESREHEFVHWLNYKETIGFNAASLAPAFNYNRKGRAMAFAGPGIGVDWLEIEGPINNTWPPLPHKLLFGELPIVEFKQAEQPNVKLPKRKLLRQEIVHVRNRPDPTTGLWSVKSEQPLVDADRLLATFLPKAFRRPVPAEVREAYVAKVDERLQAGDCFELAMRWAYRAALCSPDFLYHVEPVENNAKVDEYALASRLSYFFWNSQPDERLLALAKDKKLAKSETLQSEVDRLLSDAKAQRFIDDFLGQWLKLRQIAATDPDRKLYPEFSAYLQDSMVAETRAYFRELVEKNLSASHLIRSDFAMVNEKLAKHYGIEGVSGPEIRRVQLPAGSLRGGFLTQASILKITANGTTTSPVPRGAFVMERLLGLPPEPPPPNIPAIEPDVRGASTIREQLAKHRADTACASCHAKMDPPGFALEAFDVIGGFRERYRSIGDGDTAPRGNIDPFIGISFKLGPQVDPSGILPDDRQFKDVREYQELMAGNESLLLKNLARQLTIYSTGRDLAFGDREPITTIVERTQKSGGGIRRLIHEVVQSELFRAP
ncbi:DUF1592 domain-containing protein [Anatilimnocola floriformis]|uniref:DUF1592 domain-containing protein n=1 Tax=Anatilimnocola floriformis TaxID=2948575 RepID=UPI0020C4290D|nr:DUF1592 domain-containing protein [Anatilimnocola floriformis]